ncbi:aminotransferase-like domain-containing protein [Anaerosporobacter faecicola]|uniref:aminotransferase-like domain-containing protein n=1 Tax=Anaerosporobacter faecicola TaxID=2718714 RepID=UPI001439651F|nr:PLP-dependent aminotransferase family protein [Anaerosporobacter faecicola]
MPVNSFDDYPMSWKPKLTKSNKPIYQALAYQLESDIKSGALLPGTMLPPQRELADYLDLNLSTISRAFKLCEQKGLLSASIGRGTFVSSDARSNSILLNVLNDTPSEGFIEMGAILPTLEEGDMITSFMQTILKEPGSYQYLNYSSPMGSPFQQEAANHWLQKGHCFVSKQQILFSNGSQNALCCILASLFQTGDKILTTSLVYSGIKTVATMLGIQLVALPLKNGRFTIEQVQTICKTENIKGLYLIPDFHNPTTVTMPLSLRKEIAAFAISNHLLILEDAINTLLKTDAAILPSIQSLAPENTIYIMSLSKTISPGLRMALIASPQAYIKKIAVAIYNNTISVSPLMVECAARLIQSGLAEQIRCHRRLEIQKRNELADSLLAGFISPCEAECNLRYLQLPDYFTGTSFELCARQAGVQVYAAERFAVGNCSVPKAVRIAITSPASTNECNEGLIKLRSLLINPHDFTYL